MGDMTGKLNGKGSLHRGREDWQERGGQRGLKCEWGNEIANIKNV